ncbi:uncharacterized protein EDB91DRAFT_684624 [Suillus paluster]|uniref:uncharacterized protein n=1 Tax=Suillus paluster TaxID=48578 RepID=UPI001B862309|nr:uncharacterized protein EDB91DRAFT_684624 [Suillus paluster]KAG1750347.1 hypothetical protein EDB91DRAFT_684624 [Suillus paluster]
MLKDESAIVTVAALRILIAMSSKRRIPQDNLSGIRGKELVRMLETLMKRRDFFVTPAAVAALCEICHNEQLRAAAIECDILVTLIGLFKFDNQGLSGGPRGLTELAEFENVRDALAQGSHIDTLVAFSKSSIVERSKEATEELTTLSKHGLVRQIFAPGKLISFQINCANKSLIAEACKA